MGNVNRFISGYNHTYQQRPYSCCRWPYLVNYAADDNDARNTFELLNDESGWQTTIITNGNQFAVVLYRPGSFNCANNEKIDYSIIEVITNAGPQTLSVARKNANTCTLTQNEFKNLITGWMANSQIVDIINNASTNDIYQIAKAQEKYDIESNRVAELFKTLPDYDKSNILS